MASQGTQAWDRYGGLNNNPVRYNDPTGHCTGDPAKPGTAKNKECWRLYNNWSKWFPGSQLGDPSEFTASQLTNMFKAFALTQKAFHGQKAFHKALGNFTIYGPTSVWAQLAEFTNGIGITPPGTNSMVLTKALFDDPNVIFLIIHEIGHLFDFRKANYRSQHFINNFGKNCTDVGWLGCASNGATIYPSIWVGYGYSPNATETTSYGATGSIDDFADSFVATVLTVNKLPLSYPYSQVSQSRIGIISSMIASYYP